MHQRKWVRQLKSKSPVLGAIVERTVKLTSGIVKTAFHSFERLNVKLPRLSLSQTKFSFRRLPIYILLVLLLSTLIAAIYSYLQISPQFSSLDWEQQQSPIVGEQMNLLLVLYSEGRQYSFVEAVGVLRIDFSSNTQKLILVSPQFAVRTLGGERYSRLDSLLGRAVINNQSPMAVLQQEMEDILGLQLDRYAAMEADNFLQTSEILGSGIQIPEKYRQSEQAIYVSGAGLLDYLGNNASINEGLDKLENFFTQYSFDSLSFVSSVIHRQKLLDNLETNLTRRELVDIIFEIWLNHNLSAEHIPIQNAFLVEDGVQEYFVPNTTQVDKQVRRFIRSSEVVQEQARVEIYNATNQSGLASAYSRALSNLGINVVRAGNFPGEENTTKLYLDNTSTYAGNIELIRQVVRDNVLLIDAEYPFNHTAELVLVLGEDVLEDAE